jgi:catechol 2,3-dioxygenase-like lactoylglutathione lyase family enzyme
MTMIDHISLGSHRYTEAVTFYRAALAPLGAGLQRDTGAEAAFGTAELWSFFLYPAEPGRIVVGEKTHVAWRAPSRAIVEAVHAAAVGAGARDLFTPRLRPDISETYYGAMFADLDGHRIEVLTNAR